LTRIGNIWLLIAILGTLLCFKKIKESFKFTLLFSVFYLPQLIYNTLTFGAPWRFGYAYAARYSEGGGINFGFHNLFNVYFGISKLWLNFKSFSPDYYPIWFIFVSTFLILVSVLGFKYLRRINKTFAIITIVWFWSYILFYWSFDISLSQLRYFLPAVPAFVFLFIGAMIYGINKIYEYRKLSY